MSRETFVDGVLHGQNRGIAASLLRGLLFLFSCLHFIGLEIYLLPFRLGLRKRYRLPVPVIAIGNLTSGGTGKTPMTVLVAGYLQKQGHKVAILSRGHGGAEESRSVPRTVSDGKTILLSPKEAGDEPVLLANLLPGIPVVVCRDRRKSGRFAVENFAPDVIVCDDALQYWQLHRDLDIVLLDARNPFDNGFMLPRGLLREPPAHLARAGIAVLTRADRVSPGELSETLARAQRLAPDTVVFSAAHSPVGWVRVDGEVQPLVSLAGRRAMIFSGIADGNAFAESVRQQEIKIEARRDFGDHHLYTTGDIQELLTLAKERGCTILITTEKDLVKISGMFLPDTVSLYALRIGMAVTDDVPFFNRLSTTFGNYFSK